MVWLQQKHFSAQLCVLASLCLVMAREKKTLSKSEELILTESLLELPSSILCVLDMSEKIKVKSSSIVNAKSALLGRVLLFQLLWKGR